jgi:hypothetical protein
VQMDGQPNRICILDVCGAVVNGFLCCVSLDHRALWVSTVMDVLVQGRHEPLVRPHLVQVDRPKFLYLINHVHHQACIISKKDDGKHILNWQRVSTMNYFRPGSSASLMTFCVMKLKK